MKEDIKEEREKLGINIKVERTKSQLTQQQVADMIGIDRKAYSYIEQGKRKSDSLLLFKLANLFNCKIEDFYMGI